MENNKPNLEIKDSEGKVELAKSIAARTETFTRSYASFEEGAARLIKIISTAFDKIVFNPKTTGVVSLLIAIMIYLVVNNGWAINDNINYQYSLGDLAVTKEYNQEVYEISGLPDNVAVTINGELSDIQLAKSGTNYKVVADLSGLTEGTYTIDLVPTNFSEKINVTCVPSTATVTIRKKISWKKNVSYDFINTDLMDAKYILGTPTFETTEVIVRASEETINSIALVKALIDVNGVDGSFEQYANLVAFDNNGNKVDVDMIPASVKVNVEVSSPNKSVPIVLHINGTLPNNQAIESVSMDHEAITIYAAESVLNSIDQFLVEVDVSEMVSDQSLVASITLPSGVKSTSISKVNLEFKLCEAESRTIEGLRVRLHHFPQGHAPELVNIDDAYVDMIVTGSPERIEALTADDVEAYLECKDLTAGEYTLPIYCEGSDEYVTYTAAKEEISINIVKSK